MTRDMTTGSPLRRILAFCAPLLIGNLFQQFYNLADSIIVEQFPKLEGRQMIMMIAPARKKVAKAAETTPAAN